MNSRVSVDELSLSYPFDLAHFQAHGFCPRKDVSPLHLKLPLDWANDPFSDRNWCFQLHAWRMNAPLLKAYHATGDRALLRQAFNYAHDWWTFYKQGRKTPFTWKDMAVGLRAMQIAFFLQEVKRGLLILTTSEATALNHLARRHYARLSREPSLRLNNHGLFQAYGLKLLSEVLGTNDGIADGFLRKIILSQFTESGVHKENSPEYHLMVTTLLKRFTRAGRLPADLEELLRKAERAGRAMINGAGHLVQAGDTSVRTGRGRKASEALAIHDLSSSGYVMVRRRQTSLFFTGMAHSYTHKHADELSFELVHEGNYLFIDPGKYAYENDHWRRYVVSAEAHNTISLRDETLPLEAVELTGSLLEKPRRRDDRVELRGKVVRQGYFVQQRQILFEPGRQFTICDSLQSDREQTFVSSLLLAPGLMPEVWTRGFSVRLPDGTEIRATSDAEAVEGACGQEDPLLGWYSPSYRKMEPTWVVRALCSGTEVRVSWKIEFIPKGSKAAFDQETLVGTF